MRRSRRIMGMIDNGNIRNGGRKLRQRRCGTDGTESTDRQRQRWWRNEMAETEAEDMPTDRDGGFWMSIMA